MDIRTQSESRIGQVWTAEDHAEVVRQLALIDKLVQDVYRINAAAELPRKLGVK